MQRAYSNPVTWKNYPDESSPLNETNLMKMGNAIQIIDERVCTHDTTKLDKSTAYGMVKDVTFDKATGKFTVAYLNGATTVIDTNLEKLALNFNYDPTTQRLVITLDDGKIQYIDMSSLISVTEFMDSDELAFSITKEGKVTATIKSGSITGDMLEPNYLANVTNQANIATQKATEASQSAQAAQKSAELAEQTAATAGWGVFDINEAGHLIFTKTENNLVDFQLTNGRLEVVV